MSRGTDRRTVRIAPELWEAARATAAFHNRDLSSLIRALLIEQIEVDHFTQTGRRARWDDQAGGLRPVVPTR
jgi:hypothetical protein